MNTTARDEIVDAGGTAVVPRSTAKVADMDATQRLLAHAISIGSHVAVGGARHSMGGQSLPGKDGIALDVDKGEVQILRSSNSYRVSAGTRWSDVTAVLDREGLSVAVMQSNNDFSAGGTLSVNAHGWAAPARPFSGSVISFRMVLASGDTVTCSPTENTELFHAAIGGYGLLGIVLDMELQAVPNVLLRPAFDVMDADRFAKAMGEALQEPFLRMAYGRLSVSPGNFLRTAILGTYREIPGAAVPALAPRRGDAIARGVFDLQKHGAIGKSIRWALETGFLPAVSGPVSRNTVLHTPVSVFQTRQPGYRDILHEYFVPPERFSDFLELCRDVIPRFRDNLLNVTLRHVDADLDTVLGYAPGQRICAVILFHEKDGADRDASMQAMTRLLIDGVLGLGGSFYLPYRIHASREQIDSAYPRWEEFSELKRRLDPQDILSNGLWRAYGR